MVGTLVSFVLSYTEKATPLRPPWGRGQMCQMCSAVALVTGWVETFKATRRRVAVKPPGAQVKHSTTQLL